jgi:AraC-like DNA-binding protein
MGSCPRRRPCERPSRLHGSGRQGFQAGRSIAILPDGCMDLIYRYKTRKDGHLGGGQLLDSGPDRSARHVALQHDIGFVGLRLRSGRARQLLNVDAPRLVDAGTVAAAITPQLAKLEQRLADCRSAADPLRQLEHEVGLLARRTTSAAPPRRVLAVLARPRQTSMRIDTLAGELGLTPRSVHREIVAWTGLAPKRLARIFRLQATLSRLRADRIPLATEAGYADQAHMTREFRALAAATPSALA